jgi:hypothetical protein
MASNAMKVASSSSTINRLVLVLKLKSASFVSLQYHWLLNTEQREIRRIGKAGFSYATDFGCMTLGTKSIVVR